jgi:hypothetical protein
MRPGRATAEATILRTQLYEAAQTTRRLRLLVVGIMLLLLAAAAVVAQITDRPHHQSGFVNAAAAPSQLPRLPRDA